jgi:CRISPR/Cas system-associated endonuclease Cas1
MRLAYWVTTSIVAAGLAPWLGVRHQDFNALV